MPFSRHWGQPELKPLQHGVPLRDILSAQLERAGYRVLGAADGLAALELIERERVDLVLSDSVMP